MEYCKHDFIEFEEKQLLKSINDREQKLMKWTYDALYDIHIKGRDTDLNRKRLEMINIISPNIYVKGVCFVCGHDCLVTMFGKQYTYLY